jgi:hypothetical protein
MSPYTPPLEFELESCYFGGKLNKDSIIEEFKSTLEITAKPCVKLT